VRGLDALHTGYALLPMSMALLVTAPAGGYFAHNFKPKHIVQVGIIVDVIGLLLLHAAISVDATAVNFILPLAVYGVGMGLCFSQLSNISLSAVSVNQSGEASGVQSTARQVGSSLGTAVIGSVLIASLASSLRAGIATSNVIPPTSRATVAKQISNQSSVVEFGGQLHSSTPLSAQQETEIKAISNRSTVKATREALVYTIGFTALAFLITTQLPNTKQLDKSLSMAPGAH
jgi:MFS family permease